MNMCFLMFLKIILSLVALAFLYIVIVWFVRNVFPALEIRQMPPKHFNALENRGVVHFTKSNRIELILADMQINHSAKDKYAIMKQRYAYFFVNTQPIHIATLRNNDNLHNADSVIVISHLTSQQINNFRNRIRRIPSERRGDVVLLYPGEFKLLPENKIDIFPSAVFTRH